MRLQYNDELSGSIPAEIGELSNLTYLELSSNQLSGSIPAEIGKLSNLEELYLTHNELSGSIPVEIGKLSNLRYLFLNNNEFSGSIPAEIGRLSNLFTLSLPSNRLSGSIPAEIGELSRLGWLFLNNNELSGSIPVEIGKLSNLGWLDLRCNRLSGSIPAEIGELSRLENLGLSFNQFTGSIPAEIGDPALRLRKCFTDVDGSVHEANIERIRLWGITTGCERLMFCPARTVTRAQMAAFLYRAAEHLYGAPAPSGEVRLSDVADGAWYRPYARWAVANGVIRAPGGNFEPGGAVSRADMAEMLVAAFAHLTAPDRAGGVFTDTARLTDGAVRAVEGIAAAEVTTGCATGPRRYCPDRTVTRAQMASFLARAVQSAEGTATPPDPPPLPPSMTLPGSGAFVLTRPASPTFLAYGWAYAYTGLEPGNFFWKRTDRQGTLLLEDFLLGLGDDLFTGTYTRNPQNTGVRVYNPTLEIETAQSSSGPWTAGYSLPAGHRNRLTFDDAGRRRPPDHRVLFIDYGGPFHYTGNDDTLSAAPFLRIRWAWSFASDTPAPALPAWP